MLLKLALENFFSKAGLVEHSPENGTASNIYLMSPSVEPFHGRNSAEKLLDGLHSSDSPRNGRRQSGAGSLNLACSTKFLYNTVPGTGSKEVEGF